MEPLQTINYSGIFLSCFTDDHTSCVHATKDHTLLYLYSGEQVIDNNGEKMTIHPGECVFIRRDHRVVMYKQPFGEEQYKGISLTFRRSMLRDFYNKMDKAEIPKNVKTPEESVFKIPVRPDITSLFQSLIPYFDSAVHPTEEIVNLKEQEGVYCLLNTDKKFFPVLFDFTEPWKIDILDFLNENYMYELTMEEIASYTGRSLATFKRDFAKVSDTTPQKWLINKRLEIAYEKLQNENKKVSDVYVEVGFKNVSHFYSAFKKQYGFSPKK
ncbi:MAG: AraC family transcriptional regulator [Bacteroidales bacterium]|jgi:AraC-like DNA-binding protein|nr:AraC family transcriptional regulator [Bacteroidales bacterium]